MWISHETDDEDRLSESIARVVAMSVMDAAVVAGLTGGGGGSGGEAGGGGDYDYNGGCGLNFGGADGEGNASLVRDGWICESESMDVIGDDENEDENEHDDNDEDFVNISINVSGGGGGGDDRTNSAPKKPIIDHSENIGFLLDSIKMLGKIVCLY